jgi:hypothetical protein
MSMKEFKINDENKITSGFTTPEGYFENFTIDINNYESQLKTDRKVIPLNRKQLLTLVAAVLVVALSVTIYTKLVIEKTEDSIEMENYISNQTEISQYELIKLLDKKDIENLSLEMNTSSDKTEEEFNNTNEIENYLTE